MSNRTQFSSTNSGKRRLKGLLLQKDNRVCADCSSVDPKWASANIGVFICLKCCGVHRGLGTNISKVLSVTLDDWSDGDIDAMVEVGGNAAANAIYEAYLPEGIIKPGPNASHDDRMKFIRSKYELQEFLKPSLRITPTPLPETQSSLQESFSKTEPSEGMVEFIGVLKIKVVKGTNLAVRDMMTSDPYVILYLGQQVRVFGYNEVAKYPVEGIWRSLGKKWGRLSDPEMKRKKRVAEYNLKVQTTVVKSNLNPVWNEEFMLSVPLEYGPIKLEVYDYDTFSADDIMGEAEIDIQPLITSAMTYGDPGMFSDMQIGKWLKSQDNALVEDSIVNISKGKVKQWMDLKLQNVESGDLELELEWLPLNQ